jgi:hypothetical protein
MSHIRSLFTKVEVVSVLQVCGTPRHSIRHS